MTSPRQRVIRVFISSTFRDMQEEREVLVKQIFPQLRKLCEQRGVVWGEVDLRWGITEEQSTEGKVLPICLEEIRTCRPYFIGMLGERYGWVPDEIPQELLEREDWIEQHLEHSVTELEILHGVLNDPEMADHAFFYFRAPAYIDSIPEEKREDFIEGPTDEEIKKYGKEKAKERAEGRRDKLIKLKERIRASDYPVEDDYKDPVALGKLVLRDFTALIDRLFPKDEVPDQLERDAIEHEAFAASRFGIYIGRKEYFDRLNDHVKGDGPPLVVLGESGSGKSALLANWAEEYREEHPEEHFIMHFIGATSQSADWAAMLRRIMGEFKRRFNIEEEIPEKPDELRPAFAKFLHMASAKGRVVLILDALNQIEDRDGAPDLLWLPPVIPKNIRLILSTLPGRPLDNLKKREWPTMEVKPLDVEERKKLIKDYLGQYSKELSDKQIERLASAEQTHNPLYLRALLEELRVFGEHYELDKRIGHYLRARSIPGLYKKILQRYEEDYERHRPGLVRDAMSLIWAARRGLSETELRDLLGTNGEPFPQAFWAPFYIVAEHSLVSRAGLINFFHDYLRKAVENLYLPTQAKKKAAHLWLADYFKTKELTSRTIDEYPWQLAEAKEWKQLYYLLADLEFFESAWQQDEYDVKRYWVRTEGSDSLRMVKAYKTVIDTPEEVSNPNIVFYLSLLLSDTGHLSEAFSLNEFLTEHFRKAGDISNLSTCLGHQAFILKVKGDLDGAMELLKETERIRRELGDPAGLSACLGNQAVILQAKGDLDSAMELMKDQERICREFGDPAGLSISLGNQAVILKAKGDLEGAMELHKEKERICRELGDPAGLSISLGNQGLILKARGDLDRAMELHKEEERIYRELGDPAGLQRSLGNQAVILISRGNLDGAMELHKEEERICRELGDPAELQTCLGNQAGILYSRGDLDGAMELMKVQERICRELSDPAGLSACLGNQAGILHAKGDHDGAMELMKVQERICRELGDPAGLQLSLGNQAVILKARGDLDGAMELLKEVERICRKLGDPAELQACLGNQALILETRGDLDGALELLKEKERICRELGDPYGLGI